ncbi:MAG: glutamyl-tRNA reductase [Sarcina sp.]
MLVLIGIKKSIPVYIREKLAMTEEKQKICLQKLKDEFETAVIINTCNRTEIYINVKNFSEEDDIKKVFNLISWDLDLLNYCFIFKEEKVVKHLFEVSCGFHSKITGEDQILGQVKEALRFATIEETKGKVLDRLFQSAVACGKKFRSESNLYKIPVSSASIVINECISKGVKKIIIIGFGDVGQKIYKYAKANNINDIIIVVNNVAKKRVGIGKDDKVMSYAKAKAYFNESDAIISCTSSEDVILNAQDIDIQGRDLLIFDLAVPRDIDEKIGKYNRVSLINIDEVSKLDDINKNNRKKLMEENRFIVNDSINSFLEWLELRSISEEIIEIKKFSSGIAKERCETFYNKSKTKEDVKLANLMINSTSNVYANKAIEILKQEKLRGNEKECLRILKMIFC